MDVQRQTGSFRSFLLATVADDQPAIEWRPTVLVRIAPLATIALIALIGLGGIIWHPEGLFNRHSDLLAAHLSTQNILHRSWQAEHRLPLWRSDILSGQPALTNPQATFTHPVHLLFAILSPEQIVGLVLWIHLLIGALGATTRAWCCVCLYPGAGDGGGCPNCLRSKRSSLSTQDGFP